MKELYTDKLCERFLQDSLIDNNNKDNLLKAYASVCGKLQGILSVLELKHKNVESFLKYRYYDFKD